MNSVVDHRVKKGPLITATFIQSLARRERIAKSKLSVREYLQRKNRPEIHADILTMRSRRALPITQIELRLIAAAAIIGESSNPNIG